MVEDGAIKKFTSHWDHRQMIVAALLLFRLKSTDWLPSRHWAGSFCQKGCENINICVFSEVNHYRD